MSKSCTHTFIESRHRCLLIPEEKRGEKQLGRYIGHGRQTELMLEDGRETREVSGGDFRGIAGGVRNRQVVEIVQKIVRFG